MQTVLVVEDEAAVRLLTRKVLEKGGYRVYTAHDGLHGMEVARGIDVIDLVLTDVVMPNMNGRELVRQLLPIRPGLKILYMSGYSEDAIAEHGIFNKGAGFLEKPFTPEMLTRKVRDLLGTGDPAHA